MVTALKHTAYTMFSWLPVSMIVAVLMLMVVVVWVVEVLMCFVALVIVVVFYNGVGGGNDSYFSIENPRDHPNVMPACFWMTH